jgi:hypothetical protein
MKYLIGICLIIIVAFLFKGEYNTYKLKERLKANQRVERINKCAESATLDSCILIVDIQIFLGKTND